MLTELDGLDTRKGVYVIAATNRPDIIDPAMVRPGRLDKLLYVDLPGRDERAEIIGTMTRKLPLGSLEQNGIAEGRMGVDGNDNERVKVQLMELVKSVKCDGYSGADLAALVREAGVSALRRTLGTLSVIDSTHPNDIGRSEVEEIIVCLDDFEMALEKVPPSVSLAQRKKYESLRNRFYGLPVKNGREGDS